MQPQKVPNVTVLFQTAKIATAPELKNRAVVVVSLNMMLTFLRNTSLHNRSPMLQLRAV